MINIEKQGNCLIFNGNSFLPVGTFRIYKNRLLKTITLALPDKEYITLTLGEFSINGDVPTILKESFDFFCRKFIHIVTPNKYY